jgi:AcrR family transcriptional regulator
MANRATIEKVNVQMRYGDKAEIARRTGLSKFSVNRFFNRKEEELIADSHNKIMSAALDIIADRQKDEKAIEKKTDSLLG